MKRVTYSFETKNKVVEMKMEVKVDFLKER